jgi:nicotinamide-nucleotide amidase
MANEVIGRLKPYVYGVNVSSLQEVLVNLLLEKGKKVAVAESCTGGLLAKRITEISGASQVFECGVVAYANHIKEQLLGVNGQTLQKFGAVSEQTAIEMALGVKKLANSDFGIGITGIAGPNGGTEEKPVGLVFVAVADEENRPTVRRLMLGRGQNEREYVRYAAASNALDMVIKELEMRN